MCSALAAAPLIRPGECDGFLIFVRALLICVTACVRNCAPSVKIAGKQERRRAVTSQSFTKVEMSSAELPCAGLITNPSESFLSPRWAPPTLYLCAASPAATTQI